MIYTLAAKKPNGGCSAHAVQATSSQLMWNTVQISHSGPGLESATRPSCLPQVSPPPLPAPCSSNTAPLKDTTSKEDREEEGKKIPSDGKRGYREGGMKIRWRDELMLRVIVKDIHSTGSVRDGEWGIRRKQRDAAAVAYVTFRMTLAGHTELLPHQFCCCPGGHHITHTHAPSMSLSKTSISTPPPLHTQKHSQPPAAWLSLPVRTHPQPLIGCRKPETLPLLPSQRDSAWKQRNCYHYRPLLQLCSALLWSPSSCQDMSTVK